jgi:hypothetical protein
LEAGVSIAFPNVQVSKPISMGSVVPGTMPAPIQNGSATAIHHRMASSLCSRNRTPMDAKGYPRAGMNIPALDAAAMLQYIQSNLLDIRAFVPKVVGDT